MTEAENSQGTPLGDQGLAEIVRQNPQVTPEQLIQKILRGLKDFTDGTSLVDDVTLVVCKA